ncbi:MAG: hypothetical protein AAB229_07960 [Candidatus Hydrogenedentota bacterium]
MKREGAWIFKVAAAVAVLIGLMFSIRIISSLARTPVPVQESSPASLSDSFAETGIHPRLASEYRNDSFGYSIRYPEDWTLVEAVTRLDTNAEWGGAILLESELQKVTFQEQSGGIWPGEFQVRVLSNPEKLTIDSWTRALRVRDVSGDDLVTETSSIALAGRSGSRAVIMLFDHMEIQLATEIPRGIITLSFADGDNANDPLAREHARLYAAMAESFKLTRPGP